MLKSRAGNDQSVQSVTCTIWGSGEVLTIVKIVERAVVCGDRKSTSKYGRSSVAAGCRAMSQLSSLFVVAGRIGDVAPDAVAARNTSIANVRIAVTSPCITDAPRPASLFLLGAPASPRLAGRRPGAPHPRAQTAAL